MSGAAQYTIAGRVRGSPMTKRNAAAPANGDGAAAPAKTIAKRQAERGGRRPTGAALSIGDRVPAIDLVTDAGDVVSTTSLTSDGPIVIFLYPRANTPGCTRQACGFRDHADDWARAGYTVFGL